MHNKNAELKRVWVTYVPCLQLIEEGKKIDCEWVSTPIYVKEACEQYHHNVCLETTPLCPHHQKTATLKNWGGNKGTIATLRVRNKNLKPRVTTILDTLLLRRSAILLQCGTHLHGNVVPTTLHFNSDTNAAFECNFTTTTCPLLKQHSKAKYRCNLHFQFLPFSYWLHMWKYCNKMIHTTKAHH